MVDLIWELDSHCSRNPRSSNNHLGISVLDVEARQADRVNLHGKKVVSLESINFPSLASITQRIENIASELGLVECVLPIYLFLHEGTHSSEV